MQSTTEMNGTVRTCEAEYLCRTRHALRGLPVTRRRRPLVTNVQVSPSTSMGQSRPILPIVNKRGSRVEFFTIPSTQQAVLAASVSKVVPVAVVVPVLHEMAHVKDRLDSQPRHIFPSHREGTPLR